MTKSWALHLGLHRQKCLKYQEYVCTFFPRIPSALPHDLSRYHRLRTLEATTLDALHLASVIFLMSRNIPIVLATYDKTMKRAAARIKIAMAAI